MRTFLQFIMRSRLHASITAALLMFIPVLGPSFTMVILGLVTLRNGLLEGLGIICWVVVPYLLFANWQMDTVYFVAANFSCVLLLGMLIAAGLLRQTISWPRTLEYFFWVCLAAIAFVYLVNPDIQLWWTQQFTQYLERAIALGVAIPKESVAIAAKGMAAVANGLIAVSVLVTVLAHLLFARWCQAVLYNPGEFKHELYNVRLSKQMSLVVLACFVGSIVGVDIARDSLFLVIVVVALSGLSYVHWWVGVGNRSMAWLVTVYALVILPYVSLPAICGLGLLGLADTLMNLRVRIRGE